MIEEETRELTPQQEAFCIAYTRDDADTFSNGMLAYAEAYGYDFATLSQERLFDEDKKEIIGSSELERAQNVCRNGASRLLTKAHVIKRKRELLMDLFEDDDVFDSRLVEIAKRGRDADALNAIKHRSDLKQRITKKLDISTLGRPLGNLTDEELKKLAE